MAKTRKDKYGTIKSIGLEPKATCDYCVYTQKGFSKKPKKVCRWCMDNNGSLEYYSKKPIKVEEKTQDNG